MSKIQDYHKQAQSVTEERPDNPRPLSVNASNPKEAKPGKIDGTPSKETEQFLISLLSSEPFWQFFEHLADRHYTGRNISQKIIKLKNAHPYYFHTCVMADILLRIIVLTILISSASTAIFKILS